MKKLIILAILIVAVSVSAAPPAIPPMPGGGSGADANAYYLLLRATNAPTNGTSLGALTTGLVLCTVADSVCTPSTVAITADGTSFITAADYAAMKALLDLEIGTDVQAYDANTVVSSGTITADHATCWNDDGTAIISCGAKVALDGDIVTGLLYWNSVSGEVENAVAGTDYALPDAAPTVVVGSGSISVTKKNTYVICTDTCAVTPLAPAAGNQLFVRNAAGSAKVITLVNLGASNYYELTTNAAYATVNQKLVSGGVATDKIAIVGISATHYATLSSTGTWTDTAP